jgi:hypothetical protein
MCLCSYSKIVFWETIRNFFHFKCIKTTYSVTAVIQINWYGETSKYTENADN